MSNAASTIEAQRKALLSAVATQGSAGRAAYDAQIKEAEAAQQAAVKAAGGRAGAVNAPAAAVAQLASSAATIGDRYKADAQAGGAAYDRERGRLSHANSDYMGQVKGAVPIAEAYARAVAADRAEKERSSAADKAESPLASLLDALGGQEIGRTQLATLASQRSQEIRRTPMNQRTDRAVGRSWRGERASKLMGIPTIEQEAESEVARSGGVSPAILRAFLGDKAPSYKAPRTAEETKMANRSKIVATKGYKTRADYINETIAANRALKASEGKKDLSVLKAELKAQLIGSDWAREHPYIAAELIKDYL